MEKPDKYHYHELLHTINIILEMCESHLKEHHVGQEYPDMVANIQDSLCRFYDDVSNDSDEKFGEK